MSQELSWLFRKRRSRFSVHRPGNGSFVLIQMRFAHYKGRFVFCHDVLSLIFLLGGRYFKFNSGGMGTLDP